MKNNKPDGVPPNLKFLIPFVKGGQEVAAFLQQDDFQFVDELNSASQASSSGQYGQSLPTATQTSTSSTSSQMSSAASNGPIRVPTITITAGDGGQMTIPIRELPPAMIPLTKKYKDRAELEREIKYHKQIKLAKDKDHTLGRLPHQTVVNTNFKKRRSDQMAGASKLRDELEEMINESGKNELVCNYCDILIDQLQLVANHKRSSTFHGLRQIAKNYQALCKQ